VRVVVVSWLADALGCEKVAAVLVCDSDRGRRPLPYDGGRMAIVANSPAGECGVCAGS